MNVRRVHVLHVEDNKLQQRLIAGFLQRMANYQILITCLENEDDAVESVRTTPFDLVILDYKLAQGNGLNCLRRIRKLRERIPIVVISGSADPATAAELLHAGADEFFTKQGLSQAMLLECIGRLLTRSDVFRRVAPDEDESSSFQKSQMQIRSICEAFLARNGNVFLGIVNDCESAAQEGGLTFSQIQRIFEAMTKEMEEKNPWARQILRPIMLELLLRLFGQEK